MDFIEELEIIEKLRMFYKSDVFSKMSGTTGTGLTPEDHQKYHFEKIFNDSTSVLSTSQITDKLGELDKIDEAHPIVIPVIPGVTVNTITVTELPQLFQMSINEGGKQPDSPAFGEITFSSSEENYVNSLFVSAISGSENTTTLNPGSLMLVKVMNPEVHPAYHSTEASEVFLNYIPTIERSRCVPEFSVDVFTRGAFDGLGSWDGGGFAEESGLDDLQGFKTSFLESAPNLVTLRFLNDYNTVGTGDDMMPYNSADGLMTLASTTMHAETTTPQEDSKGEPLRYKPPEGSAEGTLGKKKGDIVKPGYTMQRNGMEMFTMPQSLISKKKGVNIDPFRPFMSIKSATINTQSAGQGLIAWNTAELVVEVYDRHRLNDIAFLLDPGKYAFTKFELSAGWRHQDPSSPYGKYINRIKSKELYALKSSSYTFNDSGVVTINLSLAMSGGNEISNSSMFSATAEGQGIREMHAALINDLQTIRAGTTAINSQRTTGNLLPTSVITQEGNASAMVLDSNAMARVRNANSRGGMSDEEYGDFNDALTNLSASRFTEYYTMLNEYVETFLKECGLPEGTSEDMFFTRPGDSYTYKYTPHDNKWYAKAPGNTEYVLMSGGITDGDNPVLTPEVQTQIDSRRAATESGDGVKFDKLFINAVAKRLLKGDPAPADEVHIFIYQFNSKCPVLRDTYMGDFLINSNTVSEKFKKTIEETQNLTVSSFTSVIRSEMKDKFNEQFGIVTEEQLTVIRATRVKIDEENEKHRQKLATRNETSSRLARATSDPVKERLQGEIDAIDVELAAISKQIADYQKEIDDMINTGELSAQNTLGVAQVEMPDLKISVQSKRSQDGKNILRMHVYDGKSKPNELQTFLSNLNNSFSISADGLEVDRDDTTGEAINTASAIQARVELLDSLKEKGILTLRETKDQYGVETKRYVVNTQSHAIKHTIKNSMPSITYGVEGTAINKVSMNMLSDSNMQAHFLLQTQNENTPNTNNTQTPGSQEDAQKIMPANISLDMMGCPLLRYGQEYFVDFDTNTDLDNVYAMTKITHNISAGVFKTSAQLKPTFKGSVSFSGLLNDVHFLNSPSDEEEPAASTATTPTPPAAE